jgi:hypothetical protein
MTTWKKVALMLAGCSFVAAAIIAGVTLIPQQEKAAVSASWVLLNGENHQPVTEGIPLIFPALQESDRRKIRGGALENASRHISRPADFSELKFYEVSPENKLKPVAPRHFSITIEDEEDGVSHTVQLASFKIKGKTVLSPADPDFKETSYQIASSPDGKRHVVWNRGGMWLLEEGSLDEARKISSDTHNNKNRRQLEIELTKLQQARGIDTEWEMIEWNYNPRFSPDGTKIVYNTNRDFETRNSLSVWVYDLETNTEKRLLGGGRYDYGVAGWLNDGQMLVGKFDSEDVVAGSTQHLVDLQGEKGPPLTFPGGEFLRGFWTFHPSGLIAYAPRAGESGPIPLAVGSIDQKSMTIVPKIERVAAPYAYGVVSFNPSGTKLAFTYNTTRFGRDGYAVLEVVDIARNKNLEIEQEQLEGRISGGSVKWIADDQILLHTDRPERYFSDVENMYVQTMIFSTWLFRLEGGRQQ